jgi:hypothetical protein
MLLGINILSALSVKGKLSGALFLLRWENGKRERINLSSLAVQERRERFEGLLVIIEREPNAQEQKRSSGSHQFER